MAIGFPPSPSIGTPHTYAGKEWEWTGNGWKKKVSSSFSGRRVSAIEKSWVYQEIIVVNRGLNKGPRLKEVEYV